MQSEKWLNTLYEQNYKRLYRLASQLLYTGVGHTADVQDVLQEVFLLAARDKIYRKPKPEAWLVVTTKNICSNFARSHRRQMRKQIKYAEEKLARNVHSAKAYAEPVADDMRASDILLSLQRVLSPEEYDLMYKYCIEDRSVEDIACEMNLSTAAVRMRISRIRAQIQIFR